MGTLKGYNIYNRPYFYKVNPEDDKKIKSHFDTGAFRVHKSQ